MAVPVARLLAVGLPPTGYPSDGREGSGWQAGQFFEGWFFEPGEVTIEQFVREFWLARGAPSSPMSNASYWDHLLSWWSKRFDDDTLFLFYEDLRDNLPREARVDKRKRPRRNHSARFPTTER